MRGRNEERGYNAPMTNVPTVGPLPRSSLLAGALLSASVALLHVGVIVGGPSAYAYFGAPELGELEAKGSLLPDGITAGIVLVFCVWSYYALAGTRVVSKEPPFLLKGLFAIGAIYSIRGLSVFVESVLLMLGKATFPPRYLVFSTGSLIIGVCYLIGAFALRRGGREDG